MLHENDQIKVHMIEWPNCREIKMRNYGQVFTVTKDPRTKALCIDWRRGMDPLSHMGGDLSQLTSFSWTVVFEDIITGKLYHNNTVAGGIAELAPEYDELRRACNQPSQTAPMAEAAQTANRYQVIFSDHNGQHVFWTDDRNNAHSFASNLRKSSAFRNVEVFEHTSDGAHMTSL